MPSTEDTPETFYLPKTRKRPFIILCLLALALILLMVNLVFVCETMFFPKTGENFTQKNDIFSILFNINYNL